jgi:hypothetical protein
MAPVIGIFFPALVGVLSMATCGTQFPSEAAARHNEVATNDAVMALERCEADGIRLEHCPAYVREWITKQRRRRS